MTSTTNQSLKFNGSVRNNSTISLPGKNQHQLTKLHQEGKQFSKQQSSSSSAQFQTVAAIHRQSSLGPPPINQCGRSIQRSAKVGDPHTIPPRYQPPPQPLSGILKHLPSGKSTYYSITSDPSPSNFNIKYPPDIPRISSVYIPESVKAKGNPIRFIQQQSIPLHRNQLLLPTTQEQEIHHNQQQAQDMLKFVRKSDQEPPNTTVLTSSGVSQAARLTPEQNRQLQPLLTELRALKEANQRLIDDNQELRDLCCFLDDDRQKGRKLAREWQRFGRYTASVMRQEVSAYQNKLRQLDDKQQELITDNLELKELCLYLDEERAHIAANSVCSNCNTPMRGTLRDEGDGSSSSTNAEETISTLRNYERQYPDIHMRSTLSDQTLQYVRTLERRIQQLEEERLSGASNISHVTLEPIPGRPEAVIRALQVLEVREQLERDRFGNLSEMQIEQMDDGEKALVREMCNVVWRKLESSPTGQNE